MKTYYILFAFLLTIIFSLNLYADQEAGEWSFIEDDEYCFVQSFPVNTEIPEGKTRGEYYLLVYRMHKSPDLIIQITAGFDYKSLDSVNVKVDNNNYDFYADDDTAWASDDNKVIYAMKRGLKLITTGISSKGTKVIDTYTLKGFTSAVNKITEDC